jgi:hypothetical protein
VPTRICVDVYNDGNGNGVRESREGPLAGFGFTLIEVNGNGSVNTTDGAGTACFWVAPGSYRIVQDARVGWVNTEPGTPTREKTVTVAAGTTAHLRFGSRRLPPTAVGLRVSAFLWPTRAPYPPGRILQITTDTPPSLPLAIPAGGTLTVTGSLAPAAGLGPPVPLGPGWHCASVVWSGFQCTKTLSSPSYGEMLELHFAVAPSALGTNVSCTVAVSLANNADPLSFHNYSTVLAIRP